MSINSITKMKLLLMDSWFRFCLWTMKKRREKHMQRYNRETTHNIRLGIEERESERIYFRVQE